MSTTSKGLNVEALLNEARRALARSGAGFTERQRLAVAAVCLIGECTAEQAEAAVAKAEEVQVSRGYRLWHPGDEDEIQYAVSKALSVCGSHRCNSRPRLRLVRGDGAP
jgi:hypothetical protein